MPTHGCLLCHTCGRHCPICFPCPEAKETTYMSMPGGAPDSEFSEPFVNYMKNRMALSFYKYGPVAKAFPTKVDAIQTLKIHLEKYEETGNTELLVDLANYAMIEFMHPRHPSAYFQARDSDGSQGRAWNSGEVNQKSNEGPKFQYNKDGD